MKDDAPAAFGASESRWTAPAQPWPTLGLAVLVFTVALVTRTGLIDYPPIYDELYQMLPAQSWRLRGDFSVLDGVYDRAALFTRMVAFSFDLFGEEGVRAARFLPVAVPGALLVAVVFAWTRLVIGAAAGWIVAVFLLLWPNGVEVSQYVRFYTVQGLAFVVSALLLWAALEGRLRLLWRIALGALAAAALAFALKLQMMTAVGIIGLGLWVAVAHLPAWLRAEPRLWWALGAGVLACLAVLASGVLNDTLSWLWTTYTWQPWPALEDKFFYHRDFRDNYPTFWPLFPAAALVALAVRPRAAIFCLALFATAFLLQSFGGLKNIRYLYPVMPFFFALWAAALQALLPALAAGLIRTAETALAPYAPERLIGGRLIGAGAVAATAAAAVFLFAANAAFERSARMVVGQPADMLLGKARWTWAAAPDLVHPWLEAGAVVVTSEEMLAVEWLGDFDLAYNKPRFSEFLYSMGHDTPPFTPDRRTGRPLFGEFADLERVVACAPVGVFLSSAPFLGSGGALRLAQAALATGAEVETAAKGGLALLGWRRPAGPTPEGCDAILPPKDDRAATRILSGGRKPAHVSLP